MHKYTHTHAHTHIHTVRTGASMERVAIRKNKYPHTHIQTHTRKTPCGQLLSMERMNIHRANALA